MNAPLPDHVLPPIEARAVPAAMMLQASINAAAFVLGDGKNGITRDAYLDTFERMLRGLR